LIRLVFGEKSAEIGTSIESVLLNVLLAVGVPSELEKLKMVPSGPLDALKFTFSGEP